MSGFWDLGHQLFKSTPDSFPVPFVPGDVFDAKLIEPVEPLYDPPSGPPPALSSLTSLTPLRGHVAAIHASAFFHLFDEPQQLAAAKALASLLSPLPGSLIFGSHVGLPQKGYHSKMFCHDPESWRQLWDGTVFKAGSVQVQVELRDYHDLAAALFGHILYWSVKRL